MRPPFTPAESEDYETLVEALALTPNGPITANLLVTEGGALAASNDIDVTANADPATVREWLELHMQAAATFGRTLHGELFGAHLGGPGWRARVNGARLTAGPTSASKF